MVLEHFTYGTAQEGQAAGQALVPLFRVGARLDIHGDHVIKGRCMEGWQRVGDPGELARRYYEHGADELLIVDVVASLFQREPQWDVLAEATCGVFVPVTYCGGIRSVDDARKALEHGADRIAVNTAALARPALLGDLAAALGSQAVIVSIEAKRKPDGSYEAYTDAGRQPSGKEACAWAKEAVSLGAGEAIVTSVDRDGTRLGLDVDLMGRMRRAVSVPVLIGGGCRGGVDLQLAVGQVDGAFAGAVLHSGGADVAGLKSGLSYVRRCA